MRTSWFVRGLPVGLLVLVCAAGPVGAEVLLGLCASEADKHNVEFQQYSRMIPVYRENGIKAALLEYSPFYASDATEDQLVRAMQQFQVVHLETTSEGAPVFDPAHHARAEVVGRALRRYVEGVGGCSCSRSRCAIPVRRTRSTGMPCWLRWG